MFSGWISAALFISLFGGISPEVTALGVKVLGVKIFGPKIIGTEAWASGDQELRDRLNKILYWQLADELKLTPQVEKEMIQTLEDLQNRREKALAARAQALAELKQIEGAMKSGSRKETDLARDRSQGLKKLNGALTELGLLDAQEFERLSKVLGPETLSRFFVVREELASRVRDAIRSPSR